MQICQYKAYDAKMVDILLSVFGNSGAKVYITYIDSTTKSLTIEAESACYLTILKKYQGIKIQLVYLVF